MISLVCPFPFEKYPKVVMAHGGGGRLMKRLLDELIVPTLNAEPFTAMHDAAVFARQHDNLKTAFTTDSFVISPLEFPGGDIGCLSVYGTVNDLAMAGARATYLSVSLILEEGLDMQVLHRILVSMRRAADESGVRIVTGDTKVVDRGKGDGVYINTTGLGFVNEQVEIHPRQIKPGDRILVNGDLGRHGMAIMATREGLQFDSPIESDCAPLNAIIQELINSGINIHCLRDITRGGLASILNEMADVAGVGFELTEETIPVNTQVHAACELLGLDPLYVACEGRFVAIVEEKQVDKTLKLLEQASPETAAAVIGKVTEQTNVAVSLCNSFGGQRVLDMLSGEQLPRIC